MDRDTFTTDIDELSRPDLQLNNMIDDVSSASGMFANRYTLLHPDRARAAAIYAPGGWAIAPIVTYEGESLRYPIGISSLKELTQIKFNKEAYSKVPHLFVLGSKDTNDSVPYDDGYDNEDRDLINRLFGDTPIGRWDITRFIYEQVLIDVDFFTIEGMGHLPSSSALNKSVEFFKEVLFQQNID